MISYFLKLMIQGRFLIRPFPERKCFTRSVGISRLAPLTMHVSLYDTHPTVELHYCLTLIRDACKICAARQASLGYKTRYSK